MNHHHVETQARLKDYWIDILERVTNGVIFTEEEEVDIIEMAGAWGT